jgi:hypothetical protein
MYVRKYRVVLDEINMSSSPLLQPLKLLANYLSQPAKRDAIVVDLDAQVSHISFTFVCNRAVRDIGTVYHRSVLRIHEILVRIRMRIRIRGSIPLTNGSGSCYFRKRSARCQLNYLFFLRFLLITF